MQHNITYVKSIPQNHNKQHHLLRGRMNVELVHEEGGGVVLGYRVASRCPNHGHPL